MTHYGNYAKDRLALYAFDLVFAYVHTWTRIDLRSGPLWEMVDYHLNFHPSERPNRINSEPIHSDPCSNNRHIAIWPTELCTPIGKRLPSAIIIGPRKTGSKALLAFMAMHPNLQPNYLHSNAPFKEIEFFSNPTVYSNGVAFYNNQFPRKSDDIINFEMSTSYFESPIAASRMAALLPGAKIIILLRNPLLQAYSWYKVR